MLSVIDVSLLNPFPYFSSASSIYGFSLLILTSASYVVLSNEIPPQLLHSFIFLIMNQRNDYYQKTLWHLFLFPGIYYYIFKSLANS
jgi:hypothetical protein